jgi:DNA-binding transcriptional LysR family regulator
MQFNSIEGIKTAVSLGLGAAFVSSSAIEKEIELKQLKFLKLKIFELLEHYR